MKPLLGSPQRLVERAGPEMLQMLRGQMMGQNQVRFSSAIDEITTHTCKLMASSQLQLI